MTRPAFAPARPATIIPTAARNRTNAATLRARIGKLHDELLRREVYELGEMSSADVRHALNRILRGEP